MIRINLINRRREDAWMPGERPGGVWDVASTAIAVAALVAAAGLMLTEAWLLRRAAQEVSGALEQADADRRKQQRTAETLAAAEEDRAALVRHAAQLSRWRETRSAPSRMLDSVSRSLPEGLWLMELRQETHALVLAGQADRPASVFEFAENLEGLGRAASPVEVTRIDTGGGRFEIHVPTLAAGE